MDFAPAAAYAQWTDSALSYRPRRYRLAQENFGISVFGVHEKVYQNTPKKHLIFGLHICYRNPIRRSYWLSELILR